MINGIQMGYYDIDEVNINYIYIYRILCKIVFLLINNIWEYNGGIDPTILWGYHDIKCEFTYGKATMKEDHFPLGFPHPYESSAADQSCSPASYWVVVFISCIATSS